MIEAIKQLKQALAYAKFEDASIKPAINDVLTELDNDLTAEDYEPGEAIEGATDKLREALDVTDAAKEDTPVVDDDDEDLDDEFEGLGDDEDE